MLEPRWASLENAADESSADDSSLLDAYSGAVIGALERVSPAVAFIEVEQGTARDKPIDGIDGLQRLLDSSWIDRNCELQVLRRSSVIKMTLRPIELPASGA